MARNTGKTARSKGKGRGRTASRTRRQARPSPGDLWRRAARWALRGLAVAFLASVLWVAVYRFVDPPATPYILAERWRLGEVTWRTAPLKALPTHVPAAFVAAEDANFCLHWGFDMAAIRAALAEGAGRGASTISQQVAKNVFLWHGRSWLRKALEAGFTLTIEALWPKRRILEVYLNIAEFDRGVFGIAAAAPHYFGVPAEELTPLQAARLAAVLPDPKRRSASRPTPALAARARAIADGAATILRDGRARCFAG